MMMMMMSRMESAGLLSATQWHLCSCFPDDALTASPKNERCAACACRGGYELSVQSVQSLPPCPKCNGPYSWEALTAES